jgi:hypothetical protein
MIPSLKLLSIVLLGLLINKPLFSQEEKQIVYKVASYSVETDKLIQKEFSNNNSIKIVYTCIPSGLLVFETNTVLTLTQKEEIQHRLQKANSAIQFSQLQGVTIKEAEKTCSINRSIH